MFTPEGADPLGDSSQTIQLFEKTDNLESHKETLRQERRRLIYDLQPGLADSDLAVLDALAPSPGFVWLTLAQNLGRPVCRQCIAEEAEERGIKSTSIYGNGSTAIRTLSAAGFRLDSGTYKARKLPPCAMHRSKNSYFDCLLDLLPSEPGQRRAAMSTDSRRRIKIAIGERDAIKNLPVDSSDIEIDHRDTRWEGDEEPTDALTTEQIRERYQTLSKGSNALKRERCKTCKETGIRPISPNGEGGYYTGTEEFDPEIGCRGCFYFDPDTWRGHRKIVADRGNGITSPLNPKISDEHGPRPLVVIATSSGACPGCPHQIEPGAQITPTPSEQWAHTYCPQLTPTDETGTLSLFADLEPPR